MDPLKKGRKGVSRPKATSCWSAYGILDYFTGEKNSSIAQQKPVSPTALNKSFI